MKESYCRLKVNLNVRKPLRRGVFISTNELGYCLLAFKYETLTVFCFGCGRIGHGFKDCSESKDVLSDLPEDELPYSLALKAESNTVGRESFQLRTNANISMA